MKHPNKKVMQECIKFGKKNRTVGAFIVKGDKIIVKCGGRIFEANDPTGHSEMRAIKKACKKLKSLRLKNCWMYTTFEPCPMCASAIVWAGMKGVVYGASMKDRNKTWTQRIVIPCREVFKHGTPKVKLHGEFMRKEAKEILKIKWS